MAFFPCSFERHKYRGPASHFYGARANGADITRTHLRLCPSHAEQLVLTLEPYLITDEDLTRDDGLNPLHCQSCHKLMDKPEDQVFVTAYPRSSDRLDFWLRLHHDCRVPPGLEALSSY